MKKLLALVLALVMTLSLATVSTNAAFDDADNIDYTEAVEVMNAIGVLEGDGTGNFNPKGILNREQAAKILSIVMLGKSMANKLSVGEVKFADVKATDWAAPYIAYCAANGIVVGDGTNFYPKAELTGHAFAKMLLVALGADGTYTGADWAINVAVDAQNYGLTAGLSGIVLSDKLTREQAAQMALNALVYSEEAESYVVTLGEDTYKFDNMQDALLYKALLGDTATIKPVASTKNLLKKTFGVTRNTADCDDFGRPATVYYNAKGYAIAMSVDEPTYTYAGENFKSTLWTSKKGELYKTKITDKTVTVTHNGTANKLDGVLQCAGAEVEVYTNSNGYVTDVVVIEATPFEINKATSKGVTTMTAKALRKGEADFTGKSNAEAYSTSEAIYDMLCDYSKGDIIGGYVMTYTNDEGKTVNVLLDVVDLDTVEGKVTSCGDGFVKIDGVKYAYANKSAGEAELKFEGTFYLHNDTVVYFDGAEVSTDVDDLVYVVYRWQVETAAGTDAWGNKTEKATHYYAQVVCLDGTTKVIETASTGGYGLRAVEDITKDVYTLGTVETWLKSNNYSVGTIPAGTKLEKSKVVVNSTNVRLNSETKNVITNGKIQDDLKVTTSEGIANVVLKADATVIGTKSGSNLTAAYVIIPGSQVEVLGDLVYMAEKTSEMHWVTDSNDKDILCNVWVAYDMEGEVVYLDVKFDAALNYGWGTYTTTDGIAAFTPVTEWDPVKLTGVKSNVSIVKGDFYDEYLLAGADDLDVENAIVINGTNEVDCGDIDTLIELVNSGWKLTVDLACDGNNIVIVVTKAE